MQTNILIDTNGNARIVDFGLSTVARDIHSFDSTSEQRGVTPRWASPEILKGDKFHSTESDVFAFGMVMIEVGDNGYPPC